MSEKFDPIDYALHYGGRCRECADAFGVCPMSGMPCEPNEAAKAAQHCLKAWQYGIKHGYMDNPFLTPSVADPAEAVQPVGGAVVTYQMVERACKAHNVGWSLWHEPQKKTAREVMRFALSSALSLPQAAGETPAPSTDVRQDDEPKPGRHPDADWFSPVIEFFVKNGMLDVQDEYGLEDILTALADNYEPKTTSMLPLRHVNGGAYRKISVEQWRSLGGDDNKFCDWHEGIDYVVYDEQAHEQYRAKMEAAISEESL